MRKGVSVRILLWLAQMEEKYGCLRMLVLWLFSSLGGESVVAFKRS